MSEKVDVTNKRETPDGWTFVVRIGEGNENSEHEVAVDKEYLRDLQSTDLTAGEVGPCRLLDTPEELVRKSFEFLLAREPKESILLRFNLRDVSRYFPEYEKEISAVCK